MGFKFGRLVHYFYFINFLVITAVLIYGIRFYWFQGTVNLDNTSSVFEAAVKVNELKNGNPVSEIKEMVESDKTVAAEKVLDSFEKKMKQLDDGSSLRTEFSALQENSSKLKEQLQSLGAFPERGAILASLESKIKLFESFVIENKWKTLTRMIGRIKAQIDPAQARKPGFYNYQKILELTKSLNRDLSVMVSVTEASVLSKQNKDLVLVKIGTFKNDIAQLEKYVDELKNFSTAHEEFSESYKNWFKAMGPQLALKKMNMENNSRKVLLSMIVLVVFLIASMVIGFLLYKNTEKTNQKKLEAFCLDLIKDGLLPQENRLQTDFSPLFHSEFERLRQQAHNRMSFGAIFQEAMPFPAMLLDNNLNLAWGNTHFFEEWKLNAGESLSWDYMKRFTNFSEKDPILEAHEQGAGGVFKVDVQAQLDAEPVSYEIFVSPVDIQGQRKIMVFFYPLKVVYESLLVQRENFKSPVLRTLEAMKADLYTEEFQDKIKRDFKLIGLPEVFEKFQALDQKQKAEIESYKIEVKDLENSLAKLQEKMKLSLRLHEARTETVTKIIKHFEETKELVVKSLDDRNSLEEIRHNTSFFAKNMMKSQGALVDDLKRLEETVNESLRTFRNTSQMRTEFSGLKVTLNDFRSRIMELLDQLYLWERTNNLDPQRVADTLTRVRMEMKGFEKSLGSLGNLTVNLDVTLGKIQFILESYKRPQIEAHSDLLTEADVSIDSDILQGEKLSRQAHENENFLIANLKEIYQLLKSENKFKQKASGAGFEQAGEDQIQGPHC